MTGELLTPGVIHASDTGLEPFPVTSPYDNPQHALLNIHNSSRATSVNTLDRTVCQPSEAACFFFL